ncbi:hypothetical protein BDV96DRAFT_115451 [Lophiotrema nucula]|uniref:F-box domain-containing protein n=1 Tax=Lophiotrema nucula TaxID=690887 RepID=A0A6A5Z3J8_9PLEO|nr:hypothetical protein BDV96DRAFT_115451 [Lophiotrema nucula]
MQCFQKKQHILAQKPSQTPQKRSRWARKRTTKRAHIRQRVQEKYRGDGGLHYWKTSEWDPTQLEHGTFLLRFRGHFHLEDSHFEQISQASPGFHDSLRVFQCGSQDSDPRSSTRPGAKLTDRGALPLARSCPNLMRVDLHDIRAVTDGAVLALLRCCLKLQWLSVCGSSHKNGAVTSQTLVNLTKDPTLVTDLIQLGLVYQDIDREHVKELSRARPQLIIVDGDRARGICTWRKGVALSQSVSLAAKLWQDTPGYGADIEELIRLGTSTITDHCPNKT